MCKTPVFHAKVTFKNYILPFSVHSCSASSNLRRCLTFLFWFPDQNCSRIFVFGRFDNHFRCWNLRSSHRPLSTPSCSYPWGVVGCGPADEALLCVGRCPQKCCLFACLETFPLDLLLRSLKVDFESGIKIVRNVVTLGVDFIKLLCQAKMFVEKNTVQFH